MRRRGALGKLEQRPESPKLGFRSWRDEFDSRRLDVDRGTGRD